jgi:hypothetical protein
MDCEKYKKLIEKYLDGIISDKELADLKSHLENCSICRKEFEQFQQLQNVIAEGMSTPRTAKEAREVILSRLADEKDKSPSTVLFTGWKAIAASILIIACLSLSFYLGRITGTQTTAPLAAKTSLHIASMEGIVLVKHDGFALWEKLEPQSYIYVGDTFHCAAKSAFNMESQDKSTINLNQNSMLVLKEYNGETQFYLEHGEMSADLNSPHPPFVVSTPNGRVEALGTAFTVSVE